MGKHLSYIQIEMQAVFIDDTVFRYPSSYIDRQLQISFLKYLKTSSFLQYSNNEKQFFLIRDNIQDQPIR